MKNLTARPLYALTVSFLLAALSGLPGGQASAGPVVPEDLVCEDFAGTKFACVTQSPWFDLNVHTFTMTRDNSEEDLWIRISMSDRKEYRIEQRLPGEERTGVMMVMGGGYLLMKDVDVPRGYEVQALDGPALMSNLGLTLLHLLFPQGPGSLAGSGVPDVAAVEKDHAVRISSPGASASFGAPWGVKGTVGATTGSVTYDLVFDCFMTDSMGRPVETPEPLTMTLKGQWERRPQAPVFPDDMDISAMTVLYLGPKTPGQEGITGSTPDQPVFQTLGQLRRAMGTESKAENPGDP